MYKIKQIPSDFIVEEISAINRSGSIAKFRWKKRMKAVRGLKKKEDKKTKIYTIFSIEKKDIDLYTAIEIISKKIKIHKKDFGYAGTKDKKAITTQFMSVPGEMTSALDSFSNNKIKIKESFISERPLKLGDLKGNRFTITVRNIRKNKESEIKNNIKRVLNKGCLNLFGEQRFGSDGNNAELGKLIIKENFKFLAKELSKDGKYGKQIISYLKENPDDYRGSVITLPKLLLKMFIHAYQSYIWNKTARIINRDIEIPVIGSKTNLDDYPESKSIIQNILTQEKIRLSDFVIRNAMFLSTRGDKRACIMHPEDISYSFANDELNKSMRKLIVSFFLPKGSYATVLTKEIMG